MPDTPSRPELPPEGISELPTAPDSSAGRFSISSTQASILVAVIALIGGVIGAGVSGYVSWRTSSDKNAQEIQLEKDKEAASKELARLQFESQLILKAVDTKSRDEAMRNLQFFLEAGFLSLTGSKISELKPS